MYIHKSGIIIALVTTVIIGCKKEDPLDENGSDNSNPSETSIHQPLIESIV